MIWGISNQERIRAEPNKTAFCDICGEQLIPKCGEIKIWHWSHHINNGCDDWAEPESEWHLGWKNEFPKEMQEIKVGRHRADIKLPSSKVIELQNSPIYSDQIKEREAYYDNMIWLLNGETLCSGLNIRKKKEIITFRWKFPPKSWRFANKLIFVDMSKQINLLEEQLSIIEQGHHTYKKWSEEVGNDFGDGTHWETEQIDNTEVTKHLLKERLNMLSKKSIFLIKKIYKKIPCGGWGILLSKEEFLKWVKNGHKN